MSYLQKSFIVFTTCFLSNLYLTNVLAINKQLTVKGVTINVRNETTRTTIFGIYTRRNYFFNISWSSNKMSLFNSVSPGDIFSFPLPKGKYDFCIETLKYNSKSTSLKDTFKYQKMLWNNVLVKKSLTFTVDKESDDIFQNSVWIDGSCN